MGVLCMSIFVWVSLCKIPECFFCTYVGPPSKPKKLQLAFAFTALAIFLLFCSFMGFYAMIR